MNYKVDSLRKISELSREHGLKTNQMFEFWCAEYEARSLGIPAFVVYLTLSSGMELHYAEKAASIE